MWQYNDYLSCDRCSHSRRHCRLSSSKCHHGKTVLESSPSKFPYLRDCTRMPCSNPLHPQATSSFEFQSFQQHILPFASYQGRLWFSLPQGTSSDTIQRYVLSESTETANPANGRCLLPMQKSAQHEDTSMSESQVPSHPLSRMLVSDAKATAGPDHETGMRLIMECGHRCLTSGAHM